MKWSLKISSFIYIIISVVARNSKDKFIQDFCDCDPIIQQLLGKFYFLVSKKVDQISLVLQSQVKADELTDKLGTHFKIINKVVFNFHERLKKANFSEYVLEPSSEFFFDKCSRST